MRASAWVVVCAVGAMALAGCGGAGQGNEAESPAPASAIARVHKSRCGACHVRVEPGERTRAELEVALARHHKRVHLTDEQWQAMIDYLAGAQVR